MLTTLTEVLISVGLKGFWTGQLPGSAGTRPLKPLIGAWNA